MPSQWSLLERDLLSRVSTDLFFQTWTYNWLWELRADVLFPTLSLIRCYFNVTIKLYPLGCLKAHRTELTKFFATNQGSNDNGPWKVNRSTGVEVNGGLELNPNDGLQHSVSTEWAREEKIPIGHSSGVDLDTFTRSWFVASLTILESIKFQLLSTRLIQGDIYTAWPAARWFTTDSPVSTASADLALRVDARILEPWLESWTYWEERYKFCYSSSNYTQSSTHLFDWHLVHPKPCCEKGREDWQSSNNWLSSQRMALRLEETRNGEC